MKVFMTSGTLSFLEKLAEKHPQITFYYMYNNSSTMAYYEGTGKSVFAAGREYGALLASGHMQVDGFVAIHYIPVLEESKPVFEKQILNRQKLIEVASGLQAFRLLKPITGDTYAIFTQWSLKSNYVNWKSSNGAKQFFPDKSIKKPAYFANRSFISTYYMVEEEEENENESEIKRPSK